MTRLSLLLAAARIILGAVSFAAIAFELINPSWSLPAAAVGALAAVPR